MNDFTNRTALLLGDEAMLRLAQTSVIVFGVGGVGSWCAESLVRSGIGHLTIVDSDKVSVTNINRQAMATALSVGQVKVDALRERLLAINPRADIQARQEIYCPDTAHCFHLEDYDYVVDAIDSLSNKMELILHATSSVRSATRPAAFFSSMGAALKMDPCQIRVSEFWQIAGCPLARALRKRMKRSERYPASKFRCVWSPELLANGGVANAGTDIAADGDNWTASKAQINGSIAHITAIFGFTLAGLIIQDIAKK